jgi:hypothetical protein
VATLAGPFIVTAALLGAGGASKLARPATTAGALRQMGLRVPAAAVRVGAALELAVATAAIVDGARPFAALVAASYLAFAAFVAVALRRGVPLSSCGCFGVADTPPTAVHLAINLAAAGIAGVVALGWAAGGGLAELTAMDGSLLLRGAFVVLTATSVWLAYVALTALPKLQSARRP